MKLASDGQPLADEPRHGQLTQTATPQTPRHRDALAKKVPVTPRHRVSAVGSKLLWTPRTPRTPSTPTTTAIPTVYHSARQLFARSAHPGRLVGRDNERAELRAFLADRIEPCAGGCLYVSGPPGTGKSALVNEVCDELRTVEAVQIAYVNCMSVNTAQDLFGKLVDDLGHDAADLRLDPAKTLQKMFVPRKRKARLYVVALDEIDHLLTLELEVVYTLFEWSLQPGSQLILIGIANALDFTDRFLPRLKARNLTPQLLPFLPYAAPQISSVITNKLRSLLPADTDVPSDFVPFIHPAATQLCARKVASQTGDIRKAFDICRKAIDLVESETRQKYQDAMVEADGPSPSPSTPSRAPLTDNINLCSSPSMRSPEQTPSRAHLLRQQAMAEELRSLTPATAPRATIAHVAKISAASFGQGVSQRLQTLNLQQKAALCALVSLERKKKRRAIRTADLTGTPSKPRAADRAAPTMRALYETYAALCKRDGMLHPLTGTEFRDVVGSLETLSLITPLDGTGRTGRGGGGGGGGFGGSRTSTPSRSGKRRARATTTGLVNGGAMADERRLASCVAEKELLAAVHGGVAGGILRGLLVDDDDDEEEL